MFGRVMRTVKLSKFMDITKLYSFPETMVLNGTIPAKY